MVRSVVPQTSFNSGELSPRLYGQINFEKYPNGLETALNADCLPHGPIKRRNGSQYIADATEATNRPRLVKFQFDKDGDAFILEFSNQKLRFFRNGGVVTNTSAALTNGTFDTDISGWTDNSNGTGSAAWNASQYMDLIGVGAGNEAIAYTSTTVGTNTYTVTLTTSSTINYRVGTTIGASDIVSGTVGGTAQTFQFTPSTAGTVYIELENPNSDTRTVDDVSIDAPAYELDTPYTTAQLYELTTKRIDNTLYIAHSSHEPRTLTRTSSDVWELDTQTFLPPPTYEKGEYPSTTITPAATTGTGITFTAGSSVFLPGDVGREIQNMTGAGRAVITAEAGTTATCSIVEDFPSTDAIASGDWRMDLSPLADLTIVGTTALLDIVELNADVFNSTSAKDIFRSTDVGRYIHLNNGIFKIITYQNANKVDAQTLKSPDSKDESGIWTMEDDTWDATRGYPRAVGVYRQRLVYGGTTAQPQTIWMSESGSYDRFGVGSGDSDGIEVSATGDDTGLITFLATGKDLVVGTTGGEAAYSGDTPSTIAQVATTSYGSSLQNTSIVNNEVMFLQQSGRKIRSLRYFFDDDNYIGDDLTFFVDHLTLEGIHHFVFAQEPDLKLYAVTDDGDMIVGVYQRQEKTIGWTKYTTEGTYQSVNTIVRGGRNEVWVVVQRTINGSAINYVELFDDSDGLSPSDSFLDSYLKRTGITITDITKASDGVVTATAHGLSNGDKVSIHDVKGMTEINGSIATVADKTANTFKTGIDTSSYTTYLSEGEAYSRTTAISGLDHLEGESVSISVDGAKHPNETVSSGAITLDYDGGQVVVGIPYTTTIKTLRPNVESSSGISHGQRLSVINTTLRTYNSALPTVNSTNAVARSFGDLTDTPTPLVTGDTEYVLGGWDNQGQVEITTSDPLPLMILGLFSVIETGVR